MRQWHCPGSAENRGKIKRNNGAELLKLLEIKGCIVTIDAMGCQKHIAEVIVDKEADYVFSLKGYQGRLQNDVELFFQEHRKDNFKDTIEKETSYYIGSIESRAERFGHAVRSHWGIENSLHWVLDVTLREEESRVRKDNAPKNFAVLRHIALNMIKRETTLKKKHKIKTTPSGLGQCLFIKGAGWMISKCGTLCAIQKLFKSEDFIYFLAFL